MSKDFSPSLQVFCSRPPAHSISLQPRELQPRPGFHSGPAHFDTLSSFTSCVCFVLVSIGGKKGVNLGFLLLFSDDFK